MSGIGPVTGQHTPPPAGAAKPDPAAEPRKMQEPPPVQKTEPVHAAPAERDPRQMAEELNVALQSVTGLQFRLDRELDKLVVTVVEKDSDKVIRQIPSDEMLELAKRIQDLEGLLLDKRA